VLLRPDRDFFFVDHDLAIFNPGSELGQGLTVIVFADTGVETVVPTVHAADQVVAFDMTVRHQCAAVRTTTVQHGDRVIVTNDNEVNIGDKRVSRCAIFKIIPIAYGYVFH
jgi:hypothetical protein